MKFGIQKKIKMNYKKDILRLLIGLGIGAFGLLTLYLSGSVIFDLFDMRAKQGNYVLFVIWANFICGFLYLAGSYGLLTKKTWTSAVFRISLGVLLLTFIAFLIYVYTGGVHKTDTFKALPVRAFITIIAYFTSIYTIKKNKDL